MRLLYCCVAAGALYFAYPYLAPHLQPVLAKVDPYVAPLKPIWNTLSGRGSAKKKAMPIRPIPVVTGTAHTGDMQIYLNGVGTVTAFYTVTLRSRLDGELSKVLFTEGQIVQEGELLAEIDPRPFQVQLTQAEGQLMRDQATLRAAQLDLDRYTSLRASKAITQQELDAQTALVGQNKGAVQIDHGLVDNANLQLTYCRITAPISGRIGLRMVDPGNVVRAYDPVGLAVITQLRPISLVFTISQDFIAQVQGKMKPGNDLVVEAWNRDFETKLATGMLSAIDNQVDQLSGTVRLKAIFQNDDYMLFPNQFVNARLLVDTLHDVVLVPSAAIQGGPESDFVYVVKEDSTVELRTVKTGQAEKGETVVEQGLAPGEVVVTDGVDKLQNNSKVTLPGRESSSGEGSKKTATDGAEDTPAQKSEAKGH